MINRVVNSTLIQKDIIIFSSYNVVVRLTFDWKPNLVLIVASTLEHSYENWAILSMIDVNSTYKNKKVMIPYGIVNYSYDDGINPNFFIKYSASKLYWYYTGNWASSIVCNNANTLYYYIAFP